MTPCDMLEGDGRTELLCRTADNQLAVLSTAGQVLWQKDFPDRILAARALDIDETGRRDIFIADGAGYLWRLAPDGSTVEKTLLKTGTNRDENFFVFNRPYCFGLWKPDKDQKPTAEDEPVHRVLKAGQRDRLVYRQRPEECTGDNTQKRAQDGPHPESHAGIRSQNPIHTRPPYRQVSVTRV